MATCALSWGFILTKEKKTPSKKTLKSPAPRVVRAQFCNGLSSLAKREATRRVVEKMADACESLRMLAKEALDFE